MSAARPSDANVLQAVPFFWVRDIQASLRFYVDGLGFVLTNRWIDEGTLRWCWLELGAAAIMLQEFWRGAHHHNAPDVPVGVGVGTYFTCKDALAIYRDVRSRGIDAKRPFVGNHMWVTEVDDPDGYHLFFESATDVPEDTVYTE